MIRTKIVSILLFIAFLFLVKFIINSYFENKYEKLARSNQEICENYWFDYFSSYPATYNIDKSKKSDYKLVFDWETDVCIIWKKDWSVLYVKYISDILYLKEVQDNNIRLKQKFLEN